MPRPSRRIRFVTLVAVVLLIAAPAEAKRKKKDAAPPPPPPAVTEPAPAAPEIAPAPGAASPAPETDFTEVVPAAAQADLAAASDQYRRGDYAGALEALTRAESAGAKTGLLYYQMGFCQRMLNNPNANLDRKRRAAGYFGASIAAGTTEVDPYYYLAATYLQDLGDMAKGYEVAAKAVEARRSGKFNRDLPGDAYFRLGRLYGFSLQANQGALASPDPEVKASVLQLAAEQVELYRLAAEKLESDPVANKVYLILALNEVGGAARNAGDLAAATAAYGRASDLDPLQETPGYALNDMGREACVAGDYPAALAAWEAIRGPDEAKTAAQYGLRLVRRAVDYGVLPTQFEGKEIASLDQATLERGILAAAEALRAAAAEADPNAPTSEAPGEQQGTFLALLIAYMNQGLDVRGLVLQNQLVPLVFR